MPPALEGRRADFPGDGREPKEICGGSVRLLLSRREATALRGGPRVGSKPSGRNAMSEPRFTTLTPETMTADQKRVADAIQSGPRGAGLRGPFNALLRSPELCDLVQRLGAFVRFGTSIPQRLNEMAIIMAGRKWTAQYEFYAHRRLALEAGLSPAIADAIAANQRPASMAKDEETVYDFVSELLATGSVSDPTFRRVNDTFGERGVVDLVGAVGYYSLVSMTLNIAQVPLPTGVTPPLK
jgi:4-carboxymuconolactone decarboxylase